MIEDEAKTKWCPHVRFGEEAVNRGEGDMITPNPSCKSKWNNCITSDCMMWSEYHIRFENSDGSLERIETEGKCGLVK